ncbi:hypothetical protein A4A49_61728, partial [Nicotiana attenuata]
PIVNPKSTGNLNPAAATFIPSSTGKKTGEGNSTIPKETENEGNVIRESISQWVNRSFCGNNQSCQEVPSQSLDTQETGRLANNLQLGEGKVWCDQIEDFLEEEGELNEGDDGIEVNEDEEDEHGEEEQSVNRKSGLGIQEQTKITDVQPNDKEQNTQQIEEQVQESTKPHVSHIEINKLKGDTKITAGAKNTINPTEKADLNDPGGTTQADGINEGDLINTKQIEELIQDQK